MPANQTLRHEPDGEFVEIYSGGILGRKFHIQDAALQKIARELRANIEKEVRFSNIQTDIISFVLYTNFCVDEKDNLSLRIFSLSFPSTDITANLHLWILEIPGLQYIREETQKDGKPFVYIRGSDLTVRFPDEGMFFNTRLRRRETEQIADFLRTKLPENILNQEVKVNCLLEERGIRFDLIKNKTVFKQVDLAEQNNLMLWIEGKKAVEIGQFIFDIKLKIKSGRDSKVVEKSRCLWNIKEQMYLGFVSGLEKKGKEPPKLKSKKGDIYFIVLLNESN